ncbi:MAG TPA: hypothetical protein QGH10_05215, partial [Armatimonadota bacterium]|nr:hypothetical protein [Armatimonadota bacterium]
MDGVGEASRPVTPVETVMDEIRIGARHYNGRVCGFLTGEIAQLLLYDRVLSDAERQSIEQAWVVSEAEKTAGEEHGISMEQARGESRMVVARPLEHWPNVAAFADAHPNVDLSGLPIRTDLLEAIRLCMHCLNSSFDADRDGEPFFYSNLLVDGTGEFNHSVNIGIPHVTGRCLLGNMAASLATGLPFPEDGRAILTRYLKSSFDNPDHLNSYYDPGRDNERRVELHNMREGLYGLWALMHTDEADWAKETAGLMLRSLASFTDDAGRWSPALLDELGWAGHVEGLNAPNAARMVDPLLAVHRITDDPLALELAGKYARWGIAEIFEPNGDFAPMDRSSGHVHSITSSLTGIIEYAIQTRDAEMFLAGKRVMRVGIREYFSSWGWGDEVFPEHPADELSRGEMNQTGDVIRAALHLGASGEGDYCGEYYELAECYVRSMVLPTQHREPELREFMRDTEDPADDAHRDVLARTVGGYAMQLPNDRMQEGSWPLQTQDITSGTVH